MDINKIEFSDMLDISSPTSYIFNMSIDDHKLSIAINCPHNKDLDFNNLSFAELDHHFYSVKLLVLARIDDLVVRIAESGQTYFEFWEEAENTAQ
jgi:hypothetical protein